MNRRLTVLSGVLVAIGVILLFLGISGTLFGLVFNHYGQHLRYFTLAYGSGIIAEYWGVSLIISGIIPGVISGGEFKLKRRTKISLISAGIAALVVGSALSGAVVLGLMPPPEKMSIISFSSNESFYEVNESYSDIPQLNFSVYSLYDANISLSYSLNGTLISSASSSFSGYYNSSAQFPSISRSGVVEAVLQIWYGSLRLSRSLNVTSVPQLDVSNISGPVNINDSSGPVTATYSPVFSGGIAPYNFTWSIGSFYIGNVQNLTYNSLYDRNFTVMFFENPINQNSFGFNATIDITLTVTDSVGVTSSYYNSSEFFSSYFVVNVVGD